MKQHRTALTLLCVAVVICIFYAGHKILGNSAVQRTDDAYIRADSVLVSPRVPGQITEVFVQDNQPVKAGQLLAQIDDRDYLVAQAAASADVMAAQAQLQNLEAKISRQSAVIDQAAATLRSTAASLKFAQANAQRYLNLSNAGAGTQQERQKAEADLERWRASRDRDEASRVAATKTRDVLKAQLESARAALAKGEAVLKQADLNVSYTKILAPQDGMIGQRSVRVGAYISQGQPLMAVVPLHDAFVVANFRETQLANMVMHQVVELSVDSIPNHRFKGRIASVAPASGLSFSQITPDNATGNFTKVVQRIPVKITFEQNQPELNRLRVGMSVVVSVNTSKEQ